MTPLLSVCSLFIPAAYVQFLLSVTSVIRKKWCSSSRLSPRWKWISVSISISADWQLIQSVFLPSICTRICLLTANFKIQFKLYSRHAFAPRRERKNKKQTKTQNNLQITHLHKGSIAAGPTDPQKKSWLSSADGSSVLRLCYLLILRYSTHTSGHLYGYAAQQRLGTPAPANIWLALLHCSTWRRSLVSSLYATLSLHTAPPVV